MTTNPASGAAQRFEGDGDAVLFVDRERGRALGRGRSRARAAALAPFLDIDLPALRGRAATTIIVAGSKGKGTAATFASATLAAAGLRVGTLTSPGLRSNRERIRVGGAAIDRAGYRELVAAVARALDRARPLLPEDGYLSPTGLFTLMAVRHFLDARCDAWVLEAGMGGRGDEVSLFEASGVVVTPIFGEHLGVIGDTVAEIAEEKLGLVSGESRAVHSAMQRHPDAARALRALRAPHATVVSGDPAPGTPWPATPVGENARLGCAAALALLGRLGSPVDAAGLGAALASVRLPGRLSLHHRGGSRWMADAATNGYAAAAALQEARATMGGVDAVLACVPDGKDAAGVADALRGVPVTWLRTDAPHLTFRSQGPLPSLREADAGSEEGRVLALGTVHFVGDVLELLDVDTEHAFSAPEMPGVRPASRSS